MPLKLKLSRETEDKIIDDYLNGETFKEIKIRYGTQRTKVLKIIKANGILERSITEFPSNRNRNKNRKYKYDQTFFDIIDTPEKAYFLGFIVADGHVSKYGLEIQISEIDSHILYKFLKCIKSNKKVKHGKKFNKKQNVYWDFCNLSLTSIDIKNSLNKLGLFNNKTYDIKIPEIKIELQRHFWRGVFDGDGWISKYIINSKKLLKNTTKPKIYPPRICFEIGVCGHINTINAMDIFLNTNGINGKITKHSSIFRIRISNKDRFKFLNLIYSDCDPELYLKRKHDKYLEFLEHYNNK